MLVLRASCLTQVFNQQNKIHKRKWKAYNVVVPFNLTSSHSFVSYLAGEYTNWCWHFDVILFLSFNSLHSLCPVISKFWFKFGRKNFVCGVIPDAIFDYVSFKFCVMRQIFYFYISFDKCVLFLYSKYLTHTIISIVEWFFNLKKIIWLYVIGKSFLKSSFSRAEIKLFLDNFDSLMLL